TQYPYQNEYLINEFSPELTTSDNLDIANLNDREVYNIRNIDGKYLFSVRLKPEVSHNSFKSLELWMWILSGISALLFLTHLCVSIANKGYAGYASLLLAAFVAALRIMDLEFRWLANHFDIGLFDPKFY